MQFKCRREVPWKESNKFVGKPNSPSLAKFDK
jgi:hypothetical protein